MFQGTITEIISYLMMQGEGNNYVVCNGNKFTAVGCSSCNPCTLCGTSSLNHLHNIVYKKWIDG